MKPLQRIYLYLIVGLMCGCQFKQEPFDPLMDILENSEDPHIVRVMSDPSNYELQVLYTKIDPTEEGTRFTEHSFGWDERGYFYPASTVKLPMALIAAEYLKEQGLAPDTPYVLEGDSLRHSVADDIRQILAVSDNAAYNRLYELIGRDRINERMTQMGLEIRIAHRLSVPDAAVAQRKRLGFLQDADTLWLGGGTDGPIRPNTDPSSSKGIGYLTGDSLVSQPMDFSKKNTYPLISQHEVLKRLFFPQDHEPDWQFDLDPAQIQEIQTRMHLTPRHQGYDEGEYYDGYVKFFLYGDSRERIPESIRIYNKVGYAYGTLTDAAYIEDTANDIRFVLSATLLVNEDGIFNDDVYEYDTVGIPFLASLGRAVYNWELERKGL